MKDNDEFVMIKNRQTNNKLDLSVGRIGLFFLHQKC